VSVQVFYEANRWVARCGHCGGSLTAADDQADLEAVLATFGVEPIPLPGLDLSDDLGSVID
jgi:hypothetical protein